MKVYMLPFLIEENYRNEKKIYVKECTKPLLWDRNYDYENKYYTNGLRPGSFKWSDFLYSQVIFNMQDSILFLEYPRFSLFALLPNILIIYKYFNV